MKFTHQSNEKGLTLVEILAAIVIISLIFVSIVTILNLTAKTNKTSEEIIDATYVAQQEMEYIYKISNENGSFESLEKYTVREPKDGWDIYESTEDHFKLEIKTKETEDSMVRVLVRVYERTSETKDEPKAQMETLLNWGEKHVQHSP